LIISRYLVKEILGTLTGVTVVLLLIFVSNRFVRYLSQALAGEVPGDIVFELVGLKAIIYFSLMLPLSSYLAILLTFGRLYRDSEMVALFACGVGPPRLLKTVLGFALATATVAAGLSLYVAPWAGEKGYQIREQAQAASEISGIRPGRFNESSGGDRIYYVEALSPDHSYMSNVFFQGKAYGKDTLLSSETARQYVNEDTGDRFLVFMDGFRYDGLPGTAEYKIVKYDKYAVRIKEKAVVSLSRKRDVKKTSELWNSTELGDIAQLQWRISVPISAVLLAILAVPLSRTTPRQGKYARLLIGIVVYIVYVNALSVAQLWLERGSVPSALGMWWVHALMCIGIAVVLVRQYGLQILPGIVPGKVG